MRQNQIDSFPKSIPPGGKQLALLIILTSAEAIEDVNRIAAIGISFTEVSQ